MNRIQKSRISFRSLMTMVNCFERQKVLFKLEEAIEKEIKRRKYEYLKKTT